MTHWVIKIIIYSIHPLSSSPFAVGTAGEGAWKGGRSGGEVPKESKIRWGSCLQGATSLIHSATGRAVYCCCLSCQGLSTRGETKPLGTLKMAQGLCDNCGWQRPLIAEKDQPLPHAEPKEISHQLVLCRKPRESHGSKIWEPWETNKSLSRDLPPSYLDPIS